MDWFSGMADYLASAPGGRGMPQYGTPPPGLLERMVKVESGGNPRAVSRSGAMGLLQLMPGTAKDLGVTDPFDPAQNIAAGRRYLEQMHRRYGDWRLAAMAYHAGPGNVDKWLAGKRSGVGPRTLAYPEKLGLGSARGLLAG